MQDSITVSPAYGRDYKVSMAAMADWNAGKDFYLHAVNGQPHGCYCSTRDFPKGTEVNIRYARKEKKVIFTQE